MKHEVQLMMQEEPKQRLLSTLRLHKIIFLLVKVIPYYLKKKKKIPGLKIVFVGATCLSQVHGNRQVCAPGAHTSILMPVRMKL